MELVSYPVLDNWIEDTEKDTYLNYKQTMHESTRFDEGRSDL